MPARMEEAVRYTYGQRNIMNDAPLPIIVFVRLLIELVSVACPSDLDTRFTVVSLSPPSSALDSAAECGLA